MPFTNYDDLNRLVNGTLKTAMNNERCKSWKEVVQNYRTILQYINLDNFTCDYVPPQGYNMVLYELHYHLGWALQQLGEHKLARGHYTKSIKAVSIAKNGCSAGCNANSCLMTPLFTKRAFANALLGDLRSALQDAEKAVVLDFMNPDVYCIRALVRYVMSDVKEAIRDLAKALRINSNHLCSLMLRGSFKKSLFEISWAIETTNRPPNEDHLKAMSVNPDCKMFLGISSFDHTDFIKFMERFLYSLSVPHTIPVIDMKPVLTPSKEERVVTGYTSPMKVFQSSTDNGKKPFPFRCGSTTRYGSRSAHRRQDYGECVRRHVTRPQTADQVIESIFKRYARQFSGLEGMSKQKKESQTQTVAVFQPINIRNAPRMYYRPWRGDRLPMVDLPAKKAVPVFY